MAEKTQQNTMSLGEISTIRNILMGQQIDEFNSRFDELQNQVADLEQELKNQVADLEKRHANQMASIEKDILKRLGNLEKLLQEKTTLLDNSITNQSKADREQMGKLLTELGQKLLGGK